MKPTLEERETGCASWLFTHRDIRYKVTHHSISDYSPDGTWCYYLYLPESMFVDGFECFWCEPCVLDDPYAFEYHNYSNVPDLDFHGGITWYKDEYVFNKNAKKRIRVVEIGCDYGHAFDRECNWYTLESVKQDAEHSIDMLHSCFKMKKRCHYSGIVDVAENFYETVGGWFVHLSCEEKIPAEWGNWRRKE